jgi:tetratricopeptide (TPR) repeat protein
MVAGDLVNTASRIQAAAPPGAVYVGAATKRAGEAAIAYEHAGTFELKGKAEVVELWRAVRVLGGVRGAQKSSGTEAPFVERERELRLVKELFHACTDDQKAHLVSIVGVAGIGKSRLSWEFFKYIDGLAGNVRWHRGRCLPYGEGVSFWALAEMVRTRASILEGENTDSALAKLHDAMEESVADPEERQWIEPRLAHLLGLEEGPAWDRENLFSAWRLFYERLAEEMPTVMVFEDMQWADPSLLDFIEYLLEWSKNHALFVVVLARPELMDRRPNWGAGMRNATSMFLEPLASGAMERLLSGLVPGLPDDVRPTILERAEGVPLYAVETVRMLLDRGLLVQEGSSYRPVGVIDSLEVPETLHALIAARLDGLTTEERHLIQDASILGKTFTVAGLTALSTRSEQDVESLLSSLVRKEVLSLQADPFSPERGQYGFLQELVKKVAYETLSKKDRKAKHLAAGRFIESTRGPDEDEFVEVIAAHYLKAYEAAPDAPDAEDVRSLARERLVGAAERAASLGASYEALRYFQQAAELTDDPVEQASLLERAGTMAQVAGRPEAKDLFERSKSIFEERGLAHEAAGVAARLGEVIWDTGRLGDALEMMDRSFDVLAAQAPDDAFATLAAQLGRFSFFAGKPELALERTEAALEVAEARWLPEVLSQALNTKALILYSSKARRREALALLRYALDVALENDIPSAALRAYYNIAEFTSQSDRYQEARDYVRTGLEMARRVGNRFHEWLLTSQAYPMLVLGEWDEVVRLASSLPEESRTQVRQAWSSFILAETFVRAHRGDLEGARAAAGRVSDAFGSADVQEQTMAGAGSAVQLLAGGEHADALAAAEGVLEHLDQFGITLETMKESFVVAVEAAFALEDVEKVKGLLRLVDALPAGSRPQFLDAQASRFRARLDAIEGADERVEQGFKGATGLFREMAARFYMAVTLLEHAEWLAGRGRREEGGPLLAEALEIFVRLEARPWVERARRLGLVPAEAEP